MQGGVYSILASREAVSVHRHVRTVHVVCTKVPRYGTQQQRGCVGNLPVLPVRSYYIVQQ